MNRPPDHSQQELLAARRAIAIGKLVAFDHECHRLAELVAAGIVPRTDAVAALNEADIANDLTTTFGTIIASILGEAFAAADGVAG